MDIRELADPIEVYEAADGNPEKLIALLRGGERITHPVRMALADWLEGKFDEPLPRGRPQKTTRQHTIESCMDLYCSVLQAEGLTADKAIDQVANMFGEDPNKLHNRRRRSKKVREQKWEQMKKQFEEKGYAPFFHEWRRNRSSKK